MNAVDKVRKHLKPGRVYRREDLAKWSNSLDRHLRILKKDNTLKKLYRGLYYCPEHDDLFGPMPSPEKTRIKAFLRDHRFLITELNYYNGLGVGTTQLYNEAIVYNHKKQGVFKIGGLTYRFFKKPYFQRKLTKEFLLVDLVENIERLAEDQPRLIEFITRRALELDRKRLLHFAKKMGSNRTQKFFMNILQPKPIKK